MKLKKLMEQMMIMPYSDILTMTLKILLNEFYPSDALNVIIQSHPTNPLIFNEPAGPPLGRLWQYLPHPILETLQRSEMEAAMRRRKCDSPAAG